MILYTGKKVTANELAKIVVADQGRSGAERWADQWATDVFRMTEKEKLEVDEATKRQAQRVSAFLGEAALTKKIDERDTKVEGWE